MPFCKKESFFFAYYFSITQHSTSSKLASESASTLALAMFDTNYLRLFFMIKHVIQQVLLLYSGLLWSWKTAAMRIIHNYLMLSPDKPNGSTKTTSHLGSEINGWINMVTKMHIKVIIIIPTLPFVDYMPDFHRILF